MALGCAMYGFGDISLLLRQQKACVPQHCCVSVLLPGSAAEHVISRIATWARVRVGLGMQGCRSRPSELSSRQVPLTEGRAVKDVFHIVCWKTMADTQRGGSQYCISFAFQCIESYEPLAKRRRAKKLTAKDEGGQSLHAFSCM